MKLLILDENYPHEGNLPGNMFLHVRVKEYRKRHEVRVISFAKERRSLVYEGVPVEFLSESAQLQPVVKAFGPDRIAIHFFQSWMLDLLIRNCRVPVIVWVHGYEAIGWYRRLYEFSRIDRAFLLNVYLNTLQQLGFRRLTREISPAHPIHFVFVSNWIKQTVQWDTLTRIRNSTIIPNPIDTDLFPYVPKSPDRRRRVLVLRSFQSRNYANDLSVEAIRRLARKSWFSSLSFSIIGDGRLFESLLAPIRDLPNVRIRRGFIPMATIPQLHAEHGVFLCPSRRDSQGVSMCEAMSSGLVPVSSDIAGIPEFVKHGESGLLTKDVDGIVAAIERLSSDAGLFEKLSSGAARQVRAKCALKDTIPRELELIERAGG